ncbi:MAG: hypothetical protein COS94_07235 [Candidatus Hydrogenedentes bacterium CG07_land_8_20_14_0_80_42_17]|nr:MAG: hypothetical protein AUJ18_04940 [Candidatus Hydrogenedentes bacterium CG1_02_42_14]PIU47460.1 MAG: hypothetical protein COS94_07235 [Candidatus Hydrogenedentes bacterium CG07_land_8_20_14_0_80_42_17]
MIGFAFREMVDSIKVGRTRTLMTITTVSIALMIFSGFLLISHNLKLGMDRFRSTAKIDVILKENSNSADISVALKNLPEVKSIKVFSKADAFKYFSDAVGSKLAEGIREAYGNQPFFSFIEVSLKEKMTEPDELAVKIKAMNGVSEVLYGKETVKRMSKIATMINYSTLAIGVIMTVFVLLIILNGIRSTIHARKDDIYVMRLVGASDGFVRLPFFMEGALTSFIGGAIGIGVVYVAFEEIHKRITFLGLEFLPPEIILSILIFSCTLGALGGIIAVREAIDE